MKIKEYRLLCQKNENENYFFDKYIFRKISIFFTIVFIKLGIRANPTTFISLVCCLAACFFLTSNDKAFLIASMICIFMFYTLDHVDGELARYYIKKGLQKPALAGQYFDVLVHKYSANLFLFFFSYAVFIQYNYTWMLILGFVSCIGLSGFPTVVAAKVLMQKVGITYENGMSDELKKAIRVTEQKADAVEIIQNGKGFRKFKKLLGEALVFPGGVLLCIVVLLMDVVLTDLYFYDYGFNFRMLLVIGLTPVYILKMILDSLTWMKIFKKIS